METNDEGTESGKSQSDETQSTQTNQENQAPQNQQTKEAPPRTMYLEYDRWNKGQHNISAIIKDTGDKRGIVAARIYTEFTGNPKKPVYTAKDAEGKEIGAPTGNLWELKKNIRENSRTLLEKAKQVKRLLEKEGKAIGNKVVDEGKQFAGQAKEIITGTGREQELKNIRHSKVEKSKGRELEQ